ncbi:metal ABC transporter solute-binding protein, Zn/Mn family [Desulforhopalus sp. 52FAK]
MRQYIVFCVSLLWLMLSSSALVAAEKPTVFVSILPQKYFVEQLAGGLVDVEVMVKPGASPATYEPKVSQMKKLASSAVYFSIGVPFERAWLERIAGVNPQMLVVKTDAGIEKNAMEKHLHEDDGHEEDDDHDGHGHEDEHGDHDAAMEDGLDPHIWLSPTLVQKQTVILAAALTKLLPEESKRIEKNLSVFNNQIEELDMELHTILKDKKGMGFMVFHPSWGYFAENYGLRQIPIEFEGKGPKSSQLKELILFARQQNIQVIFAQPQFSTKSARLIAREIKGEVITVDPLAEKWLDNMKLVAKQFRDAIQ